MTAPVSGNQQIEAVPASHYSNPIIHLFQEYIRPLQEQLKQIYEKQIKPLKDRIQNLEILNRKLQTEAEGAERKLQEVRFEAAQKLQALNSQIQGLEKRLADEAAKNGQQAGQISGLQTQLSSLKNEYQDLEQRFIGQETDLKLANLQIDNLDSRVRGLLLRVVELEERLRAEQAGRAADTLQAKQARLNELKAQSSLADAKKESSFLQMTISVLPLAGAYFVGGPAAWITGSVMTVVGYYNASLRGQEASEITESRKKEMAALFEELYHS